jgi:hypothetical protein
MQDAEAFPSRVGHAHQRRSPVAGDGGAGDKPRPFQAVNPLDDRRADHAEGLGEVLLDKRTTRVECGEHCPVSER